MFGRLRRPSLLLTTLLVLGLSEPSGAQTSAGQQANPQTGSDAPISAAKLNGYIKGYNTLIGTFGLKEIHGLYTSQQVARKTVKDSVSINDGWIEGGLDSLKAARAEANGGLPELDAIGDKLIPVLDRLIGRLKSLKVYYQSRANLEDGFARGKREDPLVIDEFKQSLAATDELSRALEIAIAKRDQTRLAALRKSGDEIGYQGALAIMKSKELLGLFSSPREMRDPERLKRGDTLVTELSKALEETQKGLDAAKAHPPDRADRHGLRNSMFGDVVQSLQLMIGNYRDMKRSANAYNYTAMLNSYNSAVERANLAR